MKILKEAKDELPITFLTNFISKGWEEVGNLKDSLTGIKKEFKGTGKIEKVLQDLIDAYLVCIGQLELYLEKKDYIEIPDEAKEETTNTKNDKKLDEAIITTTITKDPMIIGMSETKIEEPAYINEELNEDTIVNIDKVEINDPEVKVEENKEALDEFTDAEFPEVEVEKTTTIPGETVDYFCDFDEPDLTAPKLTDKDLYPENLEIKK